jgi:hypothetical protein
MQFSRTDTVAPVSRAAWSAAIKPIDIIDQEHIEDIDKFMAIAGTRETCPYLFEESGGSPRQVQDR